MAPYGAICLRYSHIAPYSAIWLSHMAPYGSIAIWRHMAPPTHMARPYGAIWQLPYAAIWQLPYAAIWHHMAQPYGAIKMREPISELWLHMAPSHIVPYGWAIWRHMAPHPYHYRHMAPYGNRTIWLSHMANCSHMAKPYGCLHRHMAPYGATPISLSPYGAIWQSNHMVKPYGLFQPYGAIWLQEVYDTNPFHGLDLCSFSTT